MKQMCTVLCPAASRDRELELKEEGRKKADFELATGKYFLTVRYAQWQNKLPRI